MTLTPAQLKEVRKAAKELNVDIKITKEIGHGFWVDQCQSSIVGFIEWLASQAAHDVVRRTVAKYGILLSAFEIEASTEKAHLLNHAFYCDHKWIPKSSIILVNGSSVVPYSALK